MVNWRFADGANFLPSVRGSESATKRVVKSMSCIVSPHPVSEWPGGRLVAVPGRRRAVADLRRHPDRQLRPRLALHAGHVPGGLAGRPGRLLGRGAAGGGDRSALIGALVEILLLRRIYKAPELLQLLATFALVLRRSRTSRSGPGAPEDLLGPRAPGFAGRGGDRGRRVPAIRPAADRASARWSWSSCSCSLSQNPLGHPGPRRHRGPRDGRRARRQPALAVHRRVRAGRPARRASAARCRSRASRRT